ncbi:MAG: hypothetical protein GTO07_08040, partial [Pseudomonas stutzeri]|nr:hypothetical protein [Stutzerimonas stutzeri]
NQPKKGIGVKGIAFALFHPLAAPFGIPAMGVNLHQLGSDRACLPQISLGQRQICRTAQTVEAAKAGEPSQFTQSHDHQAQNDRANKC